MISLRQSGSIGVNSVALEEYFTEDDEAIVPYFDENKNRVGMNPVTSEDEEPSAYTLSRTRGVGSITPTAFLERNDLIPEVTEQYRPEWAKANQNLELLSFNAGRDSEHFPGTYGSPDQGEEQDTTQSE